MSAVDARAEAHRPSWLVPLLRAVPALVAAGVITFSPDHSSRLGSIVFGAFALVTAAMLVVAALRLARGAERTVWWIIAAVDAVAAVLALLFGTSLPFLLVILSGWAAITGFVELALGLRSRRSSNAARDWLFIGALTAVLALVVLVVPPDLAQPWAGAEGVSGVLTASVVVVGAFGAYCAIFGVFQIVAALTMKWAATPAQSGTKEKATS